LGLELDICIRKERGISKEKSEIKNEKQEHNKQQPTLT